MVNDTLADFLARLKNAILLNKSFVELPYVRIVYALAQVLKEEGFFSAVKKFKEGGREKIRVDFAADRGVLSFRFFHRLSKPGRRLYRSAQRLRSFCQGDALVVVSTSRGLMTAPRARKLSLGGELICELK